jgi:DNA mismatch repair protein MutL
MHANLPKIKILSVQTANRIAAGEVVERPASALKELLENSLDAGATRIDVDIEGAGSKLIRVLDNGHGMSRQDLELCLSRHATSKLSDADDLEHVMTLGFRGEALPSIAAVSRFYIRSRDINNDTGWQLLPAEQDQGLRQVGCPVGTLVEVRDLFHNIPARRKFLKSPATESSHLAATLLRLALARPEVGFTYRVGGQNLYQLPPASDLPSRISALLGRDILKHLIAIDQQIPPLRVRGMVSLPSLHKPGGEHIYTYINGRFVRDKVLLHALTQAYDTLMPANRKPVAILYIDLEPSLVDVNVHPAKIEVRFRDSGAIHQAFSRSVRMGLQQTSPDPAPPTEIINPEPASAAFCPPASDQIAEPAWVHNWGRPASAAWTRQDKHFASAPSHPQSPPSSVAWSSAPSPCKPQPQFTPASEVTVLAQLHELYILAADVAGMLIIDQHAAHERLNYEELRRALESGEAPGQTLLSPAPLALTPREAALAEAAASSWMRMGLELIPFGPRSWAVQAVPPAWAGLDPAPLVAELLHEMLLFPPHHPEFLEKSLRKLACRKSVLQGMQLAMPAMHDLVKRLFQLPPPLTCPHGRPVVLRISRQELKKSFLRS